MKKSKHLITTLLITTILAMPLTSFASVDFASPYVFSVPALTLTEGHPSAITDNDQIAYKWSDFVLNDSSNWQFFRDPIGLTFEPESLNVVDKSGNTVKKYDAAKAADNATTAKFNHNARPGFSANKLAMEFDFKITGIWDEFIYDATDIVETALSSNPAADISSLYDYTTSATVQEPDGFGSMVPVEKTTYYKTAQYYRRYKNSADYVQYSKDMDASGTSSVSSLNKEDTQSYTIKTLSAVKADGTSDGFLSIWIRNTGNNESAFRFGLLVDDGKWIRTGTDNYVEGRYNTWYTVRVAADLDTKTIQFKVTNKDNGNVVFDISRTPDTALTGSGIDGNCASKNITEFFANAMALRAADSHTTIRYPDGKITFNNIKYINEMYDIDASDIIEDGDHFTATVKVANNLSNSINAQGTATGLQAADAVEKTPLVILAAYSDAGKLVSVDVAGGDAFNSVRTSYNTVLGESHYNTYNFTAPKGIDGTKAKLFIWKSMNNIAPLIPATEYPVAN